MLVGSPGVGKTHIAVSLGVEAVRCRKLTYFADCQRLVDDLKRAAAKGQLERRMRFYAHLSLLILDELGYLGIDKEGADLLFQLVRDLSQVGINFDHLGDDPAVEFLQLRLFGAETAELGGDGIQLILLFI